MLHICLHCIRACRTLEALCNALYKCFTYLLIYLLTYTQPVVYFEGRPLAVFRCHASYGVIFYNLPQGGYVLSGVCLSVCLFHFDSNQGIFQGIFQHSVIGHFSTLWLISPEKLIISS